MSVSQTVRFAAPNYADINNPTNILSELKPSRILTGLIAPSPNIGSLFDYYIDTVTGNFYYKFAGVWSLIYNFTTAPGSGVTDLNNLGTGQQIYVPPLDGTVADLRSLVSSSGKITLVSEPNDINFGVNIDNTDVGLGLVQNIRNNYASATNPSPNNDSTEDYSVGSLWWNYFSQSLFICRTNAVGSAQWIQINVAASGFLTNCANLGLIGPFSNITGSTANFRGFTSPDNSITITQSGNNINFIGVPPSGIFKDLGSFAFTSTTTTTLPTSGSNFNVNSTWAISPTTGFVRPTGAFFITGSSPFLFITRGTPSSSIGGTNFYLVNYSLNVLATSALSPIQITLFWTRTGNVTLGDNITNTLLDSAVPGNIVGSFLISSFDTSAFSIKLEAISNRSNTNLTVNTCYCQITQI